MPATNSKISSHIKKAIRPLTPLDLNEISQPRTLEEGRDNLKRFYGCVNDRLVVNVRNRSRSSYEVEERSPDEADDNLKFKRVTMADRARLSSAIDRSLYVDDDHYLFLDVSRLNNLGDLWPLTDTGYRGCAKEVTFALNVILKPSRPFIDCWDHSAIQIGHFLMENVRMAENNDVLAAWLTQEKSFGLYSNDDKHLELAGGFYSLIQSVGLKPCWRRLADLHLRYLHWRLLGPFAPYQFNESGEELAA